MIWAFMRNWQSTAPGIWILAWILQQNYLYSLDSIMNIKQETFGWLVKV